MKILQLQGNVLLLLISIILGLLLINVEPTSDNDPPSGPPNNWRRHWKNYSDELTLVYSDANVAFYFTGNVDGSTKMPFYEVSKAWAYAKDTYGPFKNNSLLYFVIDIADQVDLCVQSNWNSFEDPEFDNRLTIDCTKKSWVTYGLDYDSNLAYLMDQMGIKIQLVAKETGNWPLKTITKLNMFSILAYDMYRKALNSKDIKSWESIHERSRTNFYFWFNNWYFYLYDKYRGIVLSNFFIQLYQYWPRNGSDYMGQMNFGEFVHFWSGAVGTSLKLYVVDKFNWTSRDSLDLEKARKQYPELNYSYWHTAGNETLKPYKWTTTCYTKELEFTLVSIDDQVAFYFAKNVKITTTIATQLVAEGWRYIKTMYGPFSQDPVVYVVVRFGMDNQCIGPIWTSFFRRENDQQVVIECIRSKLPSNRTEEESSQLLGENIMQGLGMVAQSLAKETGNWPADDIDEAEFAMIAQYDVMLHLNLTHAINEWFDRINSRAILQPTSVYNTRFIRWYIPIYNQYGKSNVLRTFVSLLSTFWPHSEHNYEKQMSVGEYVHFWSSAAGVNLWHVAAKVFGWSLKNHVDLFKAKEQYPLPYYPDTYITTTTAVPSLDWQVNWSGGPEKEYSTSRLVYIDAHVAIYYGPSVRGTWPFKSLSDAWQYAQKTYGSTSPDPILYLNIHGSNVHIQRAGAPGKSCLDIKESSYYDTPYGSRTVIECINLTTVGGWETCELLYQVGLAILRGNKQTGNWPTSEVSHWSMSYLLMFDIHASLGLTHDVFDCADDMSLFKYTKVPNKGIRLFTDWYYPIYAMHGQAKVIDNFFTLLHSHWPKTANGQDYAKQLNVGEFVHFWSGAAGSNLTYMTPRIFNWTRDYERQYTNAVAEYPKLSYQQSVYKPDDSQPFVLYEEWFGHQNRILLVYVNNYIAVYFDSQVNRTIKWPFQILSQAWQGVQNTYELVQSSRNYRLHSILHGSGDSPCFTQWQSNLGLSKRIHNITKLIDCPISKPEFPPANEILLDSNKILHAVASLIQNAANQTKNHQAYEQPMTEIIAFDIYLRMGRIQEAYQLLNTSLQSKGSKSSGEVLWLRDWYFPIYTDYGGVCALSSFLSLLSKQWPIKGTAYGARLNVGQMVHFWSAGVGTNLIYVADRVFGWTERYQEQFSGARAALPSFKYVCYNCSILGTDLSNDEVVVGTSITACIAVVLIMFGSYQVHRKKIKELRERIRELTADELQEFFDGIRSTDNSSQESEPATSEPFNKDFEIPRDQLDIYFDQVLGSGAFGLVLRGTIREIVGSDTKVTTVAVKTVKSNVNVELFKMLLMELKILSYLGKHENMASLLGSVTANIKNRELFIAIEFCAKGDLLGYLMKHRSRFDDLLRKKSEELNTGSEDVDYFASTSDVIPLVLRNPENLQIDVTSSVIVSSLDLLNWSHQIASGMQYISSKNVIHRDLAARNVLLTAHNVAKISDFGLSRTFEALSNYSRKSKTGLPWRWLAIECLQNMKFSTQSDVWAFGVTLYETFSLGALPYPECGWDSKFMEHLAAGLRLKPPKFGNDDIYFLMMTCMKEDPNDRPSFEHICTKLETIKSRLHPNPENGGRCNYAHFEWI